MPCTPKKRSNNKHVHFDSPTDTCLYEICCSPNSMLGKVSTEYGIPHIRFHKGEFDILKKSDCAELESQVSGVKRPAVIISLPCADWTQWQQVSCVQYGAEFRKTLARRRVTSKMMLRNALAVGDKAIAQGGTSFSSGLETPQVGNWTFC
jgi:hypothetical protein